MNLFIPCLSLDELRIFYFTFQVLDHFNYNQCVSKCDVMSQLIVSESKCSLVINVVI